MKLASVEISGQNKLLSFLSHGAMALQVHAQFTLCVLQDLVFYKQILAN